MLTRRKEPMANLIREHRLTVAHMHNLVSGRAVPVDEEEAPKQEPRTYSLVWQETAWCDGYNVMDDKTGVMMREEPFRTERLAQEYINELEGEE